MEPRHKILLLDDDPDLLQMYREMLGRLPSRPEVHTSTSGARAINLLEAEPFRLLICDLKMPKMDGVQVLSIVRRKFPQLRTMALTSTDDEQLRSRAYALGVDLFWNKPGTEPEVKMFLECVESLLGAESEAGFRGVQSKSLMDIIQLECLSQSSSVLRITHGALTGRIWIQDGELLDAEADDLAGEAAFQRIFSWKGGHFEVLPPEPSRPRTIFKSYNGVLLETAQALDEAKGAAAEIDPAGRPASALSRLAAVDGVEFVMTLKHGEKTHDAALGLENPKAMAGWARQSLAGFGQLGERLQAGQVQRIETFGPQHHVVVAAQEQADLCVGWRPSLAAGEVRELMKKVLALWV
jgi:CheY-like chemotaxis protein